MNNSPYPPIPAPPGFGQYSLPIQPQLPYPLPQTSPAGAPNWQGRDAQLLQPFQPIYFLNHQGQMYTYAYSHSHTGLNSATIATVQPQSLLNTVSTSASSKTPQNPVYTPSSSAVSDPYIPPTRSSSHNPEQVKRRCLESNYQLPVTAKNLPPQQGIAQTSNTSAPNRTNETFEGSGRAKKNDSGVLLEEYVSSSDEIHSNQQRTTQTQKQNHAPLLQTPDFQNQQSYDLPIQTRQCSEVMQCLQNWECNLNCVNACR